MWIIDIIVLILMFVNANDEKTAAKRPGIEKGLLNTPVYIL